MTGKPPRLITPRLELRLGTVGDVPAIVDYFVRNEKHLQPFEPLHPPGFCTPEFWRLQVQRSREEFDADRAIRLFLFSREVPGRVMGTVSFTDITRSAYHRCVLGYGLDEAEQGKGLMTEALQAAIPYVFRHRNLHRIEASYMPHNRRSGRVLRRLGFVVEGYARDYLLINGRWEDHVLASLTNPDWKEP